MTQRSLGILVVVLVVVGVVAAAVASSIGGSGDEPATHVMPSGETMEGQTMEEPATDGSDMGGDSMDEGMDMDGDGEIDMDRDMGMGN